MEISQGGISIWSSPRANNSFATPKFQFVSHFKLLLAWQLASKLLAQRLSPCMQECITIMKNMTLFQKRQPLKIEITSGFRLFRQNSAKDESRKRFCPTIVSAVSEVVPYSCYTYWVVALLTFLHSKMENRWDYWIAYKLGTRPTGKHWSPKPNPIAPEPIPESNSSGAHFGIKQHQIPKPEFNSTSSCIRIPIDVLQVRKTPPHSSVAINISWLAWH